MYKTIKTKNISPLIAVVISSKYATMRELEEYYNYEDLLNFIEIIAVNAFNERQSYRESEWQSKQRR